MREASVAAEDARDALMQEIRKELQLCNDEPRRPALNNVLKEIGQLGDDDPMPIEEVAKLGKAHWKSLKDEAQFDLRGVFRRRALVPFVLFPRHVAARHGEAEVGSCRTDIGSR